MNHAAQRIALDTLEAGATAVLTSTGAAVGSAIGTKVTAGLLMCGSAAVGPVAITVGASVLTLGIIAQVRHMQAARGHGHSSGKL